MRLPDFVRHDFGMKLAALALSVFLWVTVAERRQVEFVTDLPLKYTNMPTDMTFAAEVPDKAEARIRGRGRFLRWRLQDVYFAIDLSPAGKGLVTHVVSPSEIIIPPDKEVEVLEVLEPKAIRVELDRLITRKIRTQVILKGDLEEDKILLGSPWAEPSEVVVAGAQRTVRDLSSIATQPVDVNQLAKKGKVTTAMDLTQLPFVSSDVEEVTVIARIEPKKELGIPSVPIEPFSRTSVKAKFTPETMDIVISGAESQVDSLDPRELKLAVEVTDLPKGQLAFTPHVREGSLYLDGKTVGKDRQENERFEVRARLDAPYHFELISASPDELGLVLR